jgi:hypothetical protein
MLTIEECRQILPKQGIEFTDEQIRKMIDLFYCWANIEFSNYKKQTT